MCNGKSYFSVSFHKTAEHLLLGFYLSVFGIHQCSSSIMQGNLIFRHVRVHPQVSWLKDGRFISLRDRLYTQTKKQLRGNPQAQDQDARDDQLVASLFVASIRKDATFTCRIETNPPHEQNMPITVRGETVNLNCLVTPSSLCSYL